jgi:hypothetical protein
MIKQPFEDSHKIYNHNLEVVHNFLAAKPPNYYSNSQSALLLDLIHGQKDISSLPGLHDRLSPPSRMEKQASNLSQLFTVFSPKLLRETHHSQVLGDFLGFLMQSSDLDAKEYAASAFVCLMDLLGDYQAPVSRSNWFSRHSQTTTKHLSRWRGPWLRGTLWWGENIGFYWHLRTWIPDHPWSSFGTKASPTQDVVTIYWDKLGSQYCRSLLVQFLLERSSYSEHLLNFSRQRVFRFGYLHRKHPTHMKQVVIALAKYIQRVTGKADEVRVCESIWGRDTRLFTR